jgi:molecular chaperone DnaJ
MSTTTDLYELLGVERSASAEEIKRAFRKLARQYHPDVSSEPDAEQRFKEINLAYEVLSDPGKRAQYDQFGTTGGSGGFGGQDFSGGFGNLSDIFDFFFNGGMGGGFGGQAQRRDWQPGDSIQRAAHLTLTEVLSGKQLELSVERRETCATCNGSRAQPGSSVHTCETCAGRGMVVQVRDTLLGRMQTQTTCPTCHGEGVQISEPCKDCRGMGLQYQKRSIEVNVPPGIEDGNVLRVSGQGHQGRGGAPAGDLLVQLSVEPDQRFQRHGADLLTELPVSFADLALGASVEVATLTGTQQLRIPAGTESHHRFTLRGEGLPRLRSGQRGALYVQVVVDVPKKLSARERELLEELRAGGKPQSEPKPAKNLFGRKKK